MSTSRRSFTAEFKREAVQMIQQQGLSVAEAARRLDVHVSLLTKLSAISSRRRNLRLLSGFVRGS